MLNWTTERRTLVAFGVGVAGGVVGWSGDINIHGPNAWRFMLWATLWLAGTAQLLLRGLFALLGSRPPDREDERITNQMGTAGAFVAGLMLPALVDGLLRTVRLLR